MKQPDVRLPYIIHTDASSKAIGAVLMQKDSESNVNTVSTASPEMNSAEELITMREKELLVAVYALEKSRIHVYGKNPVEYR